MADKTIFQLEEEFRVLLANYGATFEIYDSREGSKGKEFGKHIQVYFPGKMPLPGIVVLEVKALIERYYAPVRQFIAEKGLSNLPGSSDVLYRVVIFIFEEAE